MGRGAYIAPPALYAPTTTSARPHPSIPSSPRPGPPSRDPQAARWALTHALYSRARPFSPPPRRAAHLARSHPARSSLASACLYSLRTHAPVGRGRAGQVGVWVQGEISPGFDLGHGRRRRRVARARLGSRRSRGCQPLGRGPRLHHRHGITGRRSSQRSVKFTSSGARAGWTD